MKIKKVETEKIRPLRHTTLRKGKPFSTTSYLKDEEKKTIHLVCIENKEIITCATFYPEQTKKIKSENPYRLRGMATKTKFRRKGFGKKLMIESFNILKKKECDVLWCNARLVAFEFYKSLGFKKRGELFNIKGIGPHYYMYKKLFKG